MKLKVCGIKTIEQLQALQQMGVDYAGLIFYEGSKRFVGNALISHKADIRDLHIRRVGVFVNADFDQVLKAIEDYGLYAIQLHGDETDEYCLELTGRAKIIKAIKISGEEDINGLIALFEHTCDYLLFDTQTTQYGGSGKQFDWQLLKDASISKPFFLSGGIGPEDVVQVNSFYHPFLYAIDVNSRFETEPGIKDLKKVQQFQKLVQHG
jgi:phosphoribosylanthranilate isomerase